MLTEADRTTLAEAGITNIDRLASAAAAFLRAHPIYETSPVTNALSEAEEAYLRSAGARPRFQFGPKGTLAGLEAVLRALRPEAHPVAVQRFFMDTHPDLTSDTLNRALSPHEWLLTGHPPEAVVVLVGEV